MRTSEEIRARLDALRKHIYENEPDKFTSEDNAAYWNQFFGELEALRWVLGETDYLRGLHTDLERYL